MAAKVLVTALGAGMALLASFPVLFASGDTEPAGSCPSTTAGATAADAEAIAVTIRQRESGGDYQARAEGSTASGAYQFTDTTWAGYGGYPHAWLAPPAVQDAKAAEHINGILAANGNDASAVPAVWYLGYLPASDDPAWKTVPNPGAGNRLTPRQYQTAWLETYATRINATASSAAPGGPAPAPSAPATTVDCSTESIGARVNIDEPGKEILTTVEGITVSTQIAPQVQQLVQAARRSGYDLTGTGYRSTQRQIELRRENCGTSDYAIYGMPSSGCSPPTARPGTSNHELGLAVDFSCDGTLILSPSSACFIWMSANAPGFGLHNLPSEPWHWSTSGA
jgi:D-alanyl-D-alanine carboxypeptidase